MIKRHVNNTALMWTSSTTVHTYETCHIIVFYFSWLFSITLGGGLYWRLSTTLTPTYQNPHPSQTFPNLKPSLKDLCYEDVCFVPKTRRGLTT